MFCCEEVPVLLLLNRGRYKTSTRTSIELAKGPLCCYLTGEYGNTTSTSKEQVEGWFPNRSMVLVTVNSTSTSRWLWVVPVLLLPNPPSSTLDPLLPFCHCQDKLAIERAAVSFGKSIFSHNAA